MAKNFYVEVWGNGPSGGDCTDVIVKTMIEATSIVCSNLSKDRRVTVFRTDEPHTHSTSAAAQAYIDVELFVLTAVNAET